MSFNKNLEVTKFLEKPYKYGFQTDIKNQNFPVGLNINIIELISILKKEPIFLKNFRKKSYKIWKEKIFPNWQNLNFSMIDFQSIIYYSIPKDINEKTKIEETLKDLNLFLIEEKNCSNIALDIIFDSISVNTSYKEKLAKQGVIFCSISEAIAFYPELIQKYLGLVVPPEDNYFSALNSSVFSDGSFCYIPKNIECPLNLSTYFRINNLESGQFERTLIVAEENSKVVYLEGCTAPEYSKHQLHAAVVELISYESSSIEYSTVQNWYSGDKFGEGGIYNFVTKRGLCIGEKSKISWTQVEVGSAITWKYPSCILLGEESSGLFYSIALTKNYQQADTGSKMIHLGKYTKSKILSKGISCDHSQNTYRGLIKITNNAKFSRNFSQCDSFLIGNSSKSFTYPYLHLFNSTSILEHEATISKINQEQLFYLQQRGITTEKAISLIINGFCKEVILKLPLEFALEADQLLSFKLDPLTS